MKVNRITEPFTLGALSIDPHRRQVRVDGQLVNLTKSEYNLLLALAVEPDACVTYEDLVRNHYDIPMDWDEFDLPKTRTIASTVVRLRKKLGCPEFVKTVWGVGFRLVEPAEAEVAA